MKKSNEVSNTSTKAEKSINSLDDAVKVLSPSALSAVAGVTALIGAVKGLSSAFQSAIANYSHFEKMEMGLTTFFQDAEKGKQKFEELRKLSNETTFGVDELTNSFTQLANVGVNTNTIKDKLVMLGNLASGDKAKFAELTSIYAKIQSTGKAGAMQLQQIASRGIPIYDILKKMGVQGTATGEQITKAFEQMTEEGGQFYNAMENINSTIEGKEGFISDYFKEMTVNFAEVSGIADAYKSVLDIVREKIGDVSDKLLEWNSNPMMKAILRGTLVAGVTALAVAIGVGLVGAVNTLNKKLAITATLKGILNPTSIALGIGISAVLGLATAFETATASASEYVDKVKEVQEEEKKNLYGLNDVDIAKARANKDKGTVSFKELLAVAREDKMVAELNAQIAKEQVSASGGKNYQDYVNAQKKFDLRKQEYEIAKSVYERSVGIFKADEKTVNAIKDQVTEFETFQKALGNAEQNYSAIFKKEQELKEVEAERKNYLEFINKQFFGTAKDASGHPLALSLSDEEKEQYEKDLNAINKKYKELQIEVRIGNLSEVEQNLQKVLGLSNEEVWKLDPKDQKDWIKKATEYNAKREQIVQKAYKDAGINKSVTPKNQFAEKLQAEKSRYESLALLNVNGEYNEALKESKNNLNVLSDEFIKAGGTAKQLDEILGNTTMAFSDVIEELKNSGIGGMAGGGMLEGLANNSSDLSAGIQGFEQGGIWGAVISMLINAFWNVAKECENFEEVMNPITSAMQQLKPFIVWILDKAVKYSHHIEAMFNVIAELFEALEPLIDVLIDTILEPLNFWLSIFGNIIRALVPIIKMVAEGLANFVKFITFGMVDAMKSYNDAFAETRRIEDEKQDEEKKLLEELKKQNEAYQSLLSAMKENEDWYIRQKTALNANTRKQGYQSVNDMILTPQGKFSTHPNDYIIATKNPNSLGGGAVVNVNIENTVSDVDVTATPINRNGIQEIMIQISRKIADDVANGANGWDSALSRQAVRTAGRQISF